MSSHSSYINEILKFRRELNPESTRDEIFKMIGAVGNGLSEEKKKLYVDMYPANKGRYFKVNWYPRPNRVICSKIK